MSRFSILGDERQRERIRSRTTKYHCAGGQVIYCTTRVTLTSKSRLRQSTLKDKCHLPLLAKG
jgi:hypothetical protein